MGKSDSCTFSESLSSWIIHQRESDVAGVERHNARGYGRTQLQIDREAVVVPGWDISNHILRGSGEHSWAETHRSGWRCEGHCQRHARGHGRVELRGHLHSPA